MIILAYDMEVFSNLNLIVFYDGKDFYEFDQTQYAELRKFVSKHCILIGYNNFSYDDVLLRVILDDIKITEKDVYKLSKTMIESGRYPDSIWKLQYSPVQWARSVDMYQVLNKKGSLKEWECREHMPSVKEANVDFNAPLPQDKFKQIRSYCRNDVIAVWNLYQTYKENVTLRVKLKEMFELNDRVFVNGDAGIAQQLLIDKYNKRTGNWSTVARKMAAKSDENTICVWPMPEIASKRVRYTTPEFKAFYKFMRECELVSTDDKNQQWEYRHPSLAGMKDKKGNPIPAFADPIQLGGLQYKIGVGGIHSDDAPGRFYGSKDVAIIDLDVTSYYPSLMIVENLFPKHLGPQFIQDFREIRDMRVKAKKEGRTTDANALKIVANSTFGKFNDIYSPLRTCVNAMRVTVNGQLEILMLAEMLEVAGVRLLSANTDGITCMWHRDRLHIINDIAKEWEKITGHQLEQAEYQTYCRRDVNNYIAQKIDGKIKYKGAFNPAPDNGKTDERIIKKAAEEWLLHSKPIRETVEASTDIRDFVFYQRVKNGGDLYHGDNKIGRIARWYRTSDESAATVQRKDKDGSYTKLPNGERACLILDLPTSLPSDIDYQYYIDEATRLVESITKRTKRKAKA